MIQKEKIGIGQKTTINYPPRKVTKRVETNSNTNLVRLLQSTAIITFLGVWIHLCLQSNMYVKEAIVCSLIVAFVMMVKATEQDGIWKKNIK